ncbi:MAG TPA: carbohydrate porin, partial [Cyclobacteriaceae bacterium]|nr:carbohydrate porin [Cyclobacteriaceae bacterium]
MKTKGLLLKNFIRNFLFQPFAFAMIISSPSILFGQEKTEEKNPASTSIHYQATTVSQWAGNFNSPYVGSQSFLPQQNGMTISATYFYAHKLSKNTEFVVNPEMAGGAGLSGVYGIGSFTNAEAMRTGQKAPFVYVARAFVKHNFPLSSEMVWQDDAANTVAGYIPKERLSLIVGKFALTDYFDGNSISHDGRTQFFNWSIGTQGAYDFAADNKAYTQGILAEVVKEKWKLRYAITQLSLVPNGLEFNYNVTQAFHQVIELEKPISIVAGRPGVIRALFYATANKYGVFTEAMTEGIAKPFDSLRNNVHF